MFAFYEILCYTIRIPTEKALTCRKYYEMIDGTLIVQRDTQEKRYMRLKLNN